MNNAAVKVNTVLRLRSRLLREECGIFVVAPCAQIWSGAARYQWEG